MYRTIEPYFRSFGVGFIRSDVLRYEGKFEQPLGKKLKLGFNYRRDEDNLKDLHSYKTILQNYTYVAKLKLFKKKLDIILNYSEIFQLTSNIINYEKAYVKTTIKTGIVTYLLKTKNLVSVNTIMTNIYAIQNASEVNTFNNYVLNSLNRYKKWQVNLLNTYNQTTIMDSLNFTNAINSQIELGYQFSGDFKLVVGGKYAYQTKTKVSQFGCSVTVNVFLHKLLSIEIKAEKLVIGDYINTLNYSEISNFPYYGYIKVVSKF